MRLGRRTSCFSFQCPWYQVRAATLPTLDMPQTNKSIHLFIGFYCYCRTRRCTAFSGVLVFEEMQCWDQKPDVAALQQTHVLCEQPSATLLSHAAPTPSMTQALLQPIKRRKTSIRSLMVMFPANSYSVWLSSGVTTLRRHLFKAAITYPWNSICKSGNRVEQHEAEFIRVRISHWSILIIQMVIVAYLSVNMAQQKTKNKKTFQIQHKIKKILCAPNHQGLV